MFWLLLFIPKTVTSLEVDADIRGSMSVRQKVLVLHISGNMLHKNTSQCKIPIAPEEGWFGQPEYSTPSKIHSTLCRFLPSYSSFYL